MGPLWPLCPFLGSSWAEPGGASLLGGEERQSSQPFPSLSPNPILKWEGGGPPTEAALSQAQIVNMELGTMAELNTPGELWIRGYCVMLGYWGEPQKTEEVIGQDKWYRTG